MTVTLAGTTRYHNTGQVQTWNILVPTETQIGDRLILCVGTFDSSAPDETITVTGGSSSTWNQVTNAFASNRLRLTTFEKVAEISDLGATITITLSYQYNSYNYSILAAYRGCTGVAAGTGSGADITEVSSKYRHYMPQPSTTNPKNLVLYFSNGYASVSGGSIQRIYSNATGIIPRVSSGLGANITTSYHGNNADMLMSEYVPNGSTPAANSLYIDSDDQSNNYAGWGPNHVVTQLVLYGNAFPTAPTNVAMGAVQDGVLPISWTHNDPDGDPQAKYKFRWRKVI